MDLKDMKKEYEVLAKKYSLPSFKQINEDFEIEKLERESETLLRSIRKVMMEKIVNSLGFLEMLMNPMNAPRMYINFVNNVSQEDKKRMDKMYSDLGDISVLALSREIDYDERGEAVLVKKISDAWFSLKKDFREILNKIGQPNNNTVKRERSYFG
ncbi:MAG: hypothetical protein AABY05_00015 [Nanoarchaeota archaeon]